MAKKRKAAKAGTKRPRKLAKWNPFPLIEKELRKRTKADLMAMILRLAKEHADIARELEDLLGIEKPAALLIADIASAIDRATDFDERLVNHNFPVDWTAYNDVQKGLSQLVELGQLDEAKSLAIKLMKDGSYQAYCSDEGMMCDDIEDCLKPVIKAVKAAGGAAASQWATEMQNADRTGFICTRELGQLEDEL